MDDDGCFAILIAVGIAVYIILGFVAGYIGFKDNINVGSDLGFPIENLELDPSGTVLTFDLGANHIRANLNEAYDRPPNLETATHIFLDGNELEFTDSENNRLFSNVHIRYVPPLIFVEE